MATTEKTLTTLDLVEETCERLNEALDRIEAKQAERRARMGDLEERVDRLEKLTTKEGE